MRYQWNANKNAANIIKHGVDFAAAESFEWDSALVAEDNRKNYGETRHVALGTINGRVHVLIFVVRSTTIRIISLRKANKREQRDYEENR